VTKYQEHANRVTQLTCSRNIFQENEAGVNGLVNSQNRKHNLISHLCRSSVNFWVDLEELTENSTFVLHRVCNICEEMVLLNMRKMKMAA